MLLENEGKLLGGVLLLEGGLLLPLLVIVRLPCSGVEQSGGQTHFSADAYFRSQQLSQQRAAEK